MKRSAFGFVALAAGVAVGVLLAGPAEAGGLTAGGDLEHARATARAGGPLTAEDEDLLERWGCLSGTDHPFCRKLQARDRQPPKQARKPSRKHSKSRSP